MRPCMWDRTTMEIQMLHMQKSVCSCGWKQVLHSLCASASSRLILCWLVSLFSPHSDLQHHFPSSREGKMLCRWQRSVEVLIRQAGEAHCAAGLSPRCEHGRLVAPASSFLNWGGWSSQTTQAEVELAFTQQLGGECGRQEVTDGYGTWKTGLNPLNVVHSAGVKLLFFFPWYY